MNVAKFVAKIHKLDAKHEAATGIWLKKKKKAQAVIEEKSLTILVENALVKYLPKETIIKKFQI